jgi:acyl-CoA reductase-like NAD-dependent aldehyde dehydrogenase
VVLRRQPLIFGTAKLRAANKSSAASRGSSIASLENIDDLALIMTMEKGKPLAESVGEIRYGAGLIKWIAEEARRICGDIYT